MNLRHALRADFGVNVLIESGRGLRHDPYVIEPCSAAVATRTQLDLLRGLGYGRQELWRLTGAAMVPAPGTLIQVLDLDSVIFKPDEIITEARSYYFDVSQIDGQPDPITPVIAWSDSRSKFSAPHQIGWLHFDRAIDNGGFDRLDASLIYSAAGAKGALYLYQVEERPKSPAFSSDRRIHELGLISDEVRRQHPEAKTPWPPMIANPFALQTFLIGDRISFAGVADMGNHLLKLRLTFYDDPELREMMSDTMMELRRLALSASSEAPEPLMGWESRQGNSGSIQKCSCLIAPSILP